MSDTDVERILRKLRGDVDKVMATMNHLYTKDNSIILVKDHNSVTIPLGDAYIALSELMSKVRGIKT